MNFCRILASDTKLHSPFFEFVGANFRGTNAECWQLWHDRGGWTKDYEVFAAIDGTCIVSTIGRTQMKLAIGGKLQKGFQLGAVATLEPYRKQGLARQLMDRVIDALDDPNQPLILFANKSVVNFYPRFGFRRVPQRQSTAIVAIQPANTLATQFDPSSTIDQQRMADLCARAQPIRGPLAAHDYYGILLWHLTCRQVTAFWLPDFDALIAASTQDNKLVLHDVIAAKPFNLSPILPLLITHPVTKLEFCFDPEDWWPEANHSEFEDADSPLFVRGGAASITGPVRFPELAHT